MESLQYNFKIELNLFISIYHFLAWFFIISGFSVSVLKSVKNYKSINYWFIVFNNPFGWLFSLQSSLCCAASCWQRWFNLHRPPLWRSKRRSSKPRWWWRRSWPVFPPYTLPPSTSRWTTHLIGRFCCTSAFSSSCVNNSLPSLSGLDPWLPHKLANDGGLTAHPQPPCHQTAVRRLHTGQSTIWVRSDGLRGIRGFLWSGRCL